MAMENVNPVNGNECDKPREHRHSHGGNWGGGVYGLGFIGAAIYFIQHAPNFGAGVLGVLKAIVWPVLLVYKFLENFKM